MGLKTCTVGVVVCSLLMAAAVGPVVFVSLQGDVNGDGRVDVLDAQLLVAQVVKSPRSSAVAQSAAGPADANRDGAINVLDLQYTLARVNGAPPEQAPAPADSKSPKGKTVRAYSWAPLVVLAVATIAPVAQRPKVTRFSVWPPRALGSSTQRYLFTLTPHAPPSVS
ncbi:MAG TPA: dockerin type I repeat-containing protein [Candidatus Bathyarchaeia archaeon]|nr:dockerin type I repeat-containing protein [Candidatus Bathyarchaeia archaeon]